MMLDLFYNQRQHRVERIKKKKKNWKNEMQTYITYISSFNMGSQGILLELSILLKYKAWA